MNIAKSIVLAGLVLGTAGIGVNTAKAGDADPSWSGFYAGANIGYGWGSGDVHPQLTAAPGAPPDFPGLIEAIQEAGVFPNSLSPSEHGFVGGGQVGYNWKLPSGWVVGMEADLQSSGIKGSKTKVQTPQFFEVTSTTLSKDVNWYGTVRARAGYLINPQWLVYATGGLAYGETSLGFHAIDVEAGCIPQGTLCADTSSSEFRVGWTLGAGVEAALSPRWSVKAEYLYVDLGKQSFDAETSTGYPLFFATSAKFHEQTVRVGLNYHFN